MKPILFNTEMVRAILDGRKTVTRRVVKPQPKEYGLFSTHNDWNGIKAPYRPGDILYVRETWRVQAAHRFEADARIEYKAGGPMTTIQFPGGKTQDSSRAEYDGFVGKWANDRWRPSIHMPKEAARLFLRVTDVRAERLQDITTEQARAEGCDGRCLGPNSGTDGSMCTVRLDFSVEKFETVWDSTIKEADLPLYGWAANPWVWVIEFERISKEEALKGGTK